MKLEVCVDSLNSAKIAQEAGAYRLELCANLAEGGTTPSYALIKTVRSLENIKLNVLIRPRGGDFHYTQEEFEIMKEDIRICGELNCDAVVIGALNVDGTIDVENCKELIDVARSYSMGITFHRAFDRARDLFQSLEVVIDLGCDRILTSGGYESAIDGSEIISQLIKQAEDRIIIMPGAGISPQNIASLKRETGFSEVHGTFRDCYQGKMEYKNPNFKNQEEEYFYQQADVDKIRDVLRVLQN